MKPSELLQSRRSDILAIAAKYHVRNLRVFGSVLRNDETQRSDIDFLVDTLPGTTLFELGGLQDDLQSLLGIKVDLLTPLDLPESFRHKVVAEAQAV
jgi:uncharacterized protein